ncbi:hypothetical protein TNCV_603881, partial [Trichonephila clavipes]
WQSQSKLRLSAYIMKRLFLEQEIKSSTKQSFSQEEKPEIFPKILIYNDVQRKGQKRIPRDIPYSKISFLRNSLKKIKYRYILQEKLEMTANKLPGM